MSMIIRGARLIDPSKQLDQVSDMHVQGGRIKSIGRLAEQSSDLEIDATGLILSPSFLDLHPLFQSPWKFEVIMLMPLPGFHVVVCA